MPAALVPNEAIPALAARIASPAMLRVLRHLQQAGFITNGQGLDEETRDILQQLTDLGLVDPGFAVPTDGKPFVWVSNHNGERVLRYLETTFGPKIKIQTWARTALESLSDTDREAVWT